MVNLRSSVLEAHDHQHHYPTPTKAKVQKTVEFCDRMSLPYFKKDVFRTFQVRHHREWAKLNDESSSSRRLHKNPDEQKKRERKRFITSSQIREIKRILKEEEFEARALTWKQLDYEIKLDCSDHTVQRAMRTMNYHKCISCKKNWVNEKMTKKRVE